MRNDSCRKCGLRMEVYQNCNVCKSPIEFICNKCNINTDKQIHSKCLEKSTIVITH